jgi:pyrroline-5-carboxylate reductase
MDPLSVAAGWKAESAARNGNETKTVMPNARAEVAKALTPSITRTRQAETASALILPKIRRSEALDASEHGSYLSAVSTP